MGDEILGGLDRPPVPAAVLVPVILGENPSILLTKRTSHLNKHAGQISFPGGRIDPDDAGAEAAALREAQEEIGLDPQSGRSAGPPDRPYHRHRLPHHASPGRAAACTEISAFAA